MAYAKPKRTKQEAARLKADLFAFQHSSWKKDRSGILTFMRLLSEPRSAQKETKTAASKPHWRLVEDLGRYIPQNDKLCPPDKLVAELIRLARVPAANTDEGIEKRNQLQRVLWFDIEREWRYREAGGKRGMLKKIRIEERCLARLVRVAEDFLSALQDVSPVPSLPVSLDRKEGIIHYEEQTAALVKSVSERLSFLRQSRPANRPAGGPLSQNPHQGSPGLFTLRLLWDVRSLGGRLTLNKNAGTGTLVDALHLLRPRLPPNFIANALPLSTLAGITALDKKISPAMDFSGTFQSGASA
jgi:hypothetical protein